MSNKFDINNAAGSYDLATARDATGSVFAMLLPMMLIMFMFSGCMAVAPESIAGEKERGTIATILVTPIKRSELAIGKIISLSVIAFLSGISSALGTFISIPKLMQMEGVEMSISIYGINEYLALGLIILSTVLLIISLISIISAFSKTVKEATALLTPVMILVMLVGVTAMFGGGAPAEYYKYFIPIYNSVQCLSALLSFNFVSTHIIITVVSNVVYACIGGFVLTRMFNSEKIIFTK
jgi:ABC-type Na+ efflux pump, permease component